MIERWRVV